MHMHMHMCMHMCMHMHMLSVTCLSHAHAQTMSGKLVLLPWP